ncbi:MAG: chemotaxis protein CheW, partial [Candidatus Desantisbacteria bacterium]
QQRESLKKPIKGRIRIEAKRERNHVIIEVSDDGAGIDIEEIKKIAVKKGIIHEEELSSLGPKEILLITTSPGYSGAKKVTETAGMGVGLNVVRTKVESFGGALSIDTNVNEGTACIIKLPVTMAMIQTVLVEVANETYCIPLSLIDRPIKVASAAIKNMEHEQVIIYEDTVLPLIGLRQRFGFPLQKRGAKTDFISIVVVDTGDKRAGLIVDSFSGQQEIVVKPLTGVLKKLKGVSGATILGRGKAAFIIDVGDMVSSRG